VVLIFSFDLKSQILNPTGPGLDARIQSYVNYNDFFSLVLADEPLQLELPNIWLWDIIDEFIYQFQSFCLYKANPGKRDKEEVRQFEEQAHDVRF
jgi:translation initiation factor 3 subunit L